MVFQTTAWSLRRDPSRRTESNTDAFFALRVRLGAWAWPCSKPRRSPHRPCSRHDTGMSRGGERRDYDAHVEHPVLETADELFSFRDQNRQAGLIRNPEERNRRGGEFLDRPGPSPCPVAISGRSFLRQGKPGTVRSPSRVMGRPTAALSRFGIPRRGFRDDPGPIRLACASTSSASRVPP